ncbi:uncharacterized protein LOC142234449 [Haematobia irritans]|uniref:uncharacterized protein LOC142234449 n=1 Tax=Haematobia irritans TaxID=7368 RepID=UPI003F4F77AE
MLIHTFKHKTTRNNIHHITRQYSSPPKRVATNNSIGVTDESAATLAVGSNNSSSSSIYAKQLHFSPHQLRTRHHQSYLSSVIAVVLGVTLLPLVPPCDAVGYSYSRFRGPVSGPEYRIHVRNSNVDGSAAGSTRHHLHSHRYRPDDEESRLDYVAKPEYEFAYGVEDAQAHILHNRNEMRDGDTVKGVYSTVDPDGTVRVVKYTADDVNGFQAEVIRNGISAIHGQLQEDSPITIAHSNNGNNHNGYYRYHYPTNMPNNGNHYHHSTQHYPPEGNHDTLPSPMVDYNNQNNPNLNHYDQNNYHGNYYNTNQDNSNRDEYLPQYEVTEEPVSDSHTNEDEDEDSVDQYNRLKGSEDKKKVNDDDYDDEDDDDEEDDYDDSEELEDYEDAVKKQGASNDNDDYY